MVKPVNTKPPHKIVNIISIASLQVVIWFADTFRFVCDTSLMFKVSWRGMFSPIISVFSIIFSIIALTSDHWRRKSTRELSRFSALFRSCNTSLENHKTECITLYYKDNDLPGDIFVIYLNTL